MADHEEAKAEAKAEEYESDPEDAPLPSMRRREASDDEDGEGEGFHGGRNSRKDLSPAVGSDGEFDGQGGAEVYGDEEDEEEYYDEDEEEEEEELKERFEGRSEERDEMTGEEAALRKPDSPRSVQNSQDAMGDHQGSIVAEVEKNAADGDGKKENEPFAVPTSGAFYMHDDRFQENGRGRHRRMFAGRKLWDSKDERAWVHDRFEEMNLQDAHYHGERRRPGGQFRGRGSGRVRGGNNRGGRSGKYNSDGSNQKQAPRIVRGRGPRHYDSLTKSIKEIPVSERKVSLAKPEEAASNASLGRPAFQTATTQPDLPLPQKHFASSLNSASPPFYPSGSSNQETLMQKRGAQILDASKNSSYSVQVEDEDFTSQANILRGKLAIDQVNQDQVNQDQVNQDSLYIDDSFRSVAGKGLAASYSPCGFSANDVQSSGSKIQVRGLTANNIPPSNQLAPSLGQIIRGSGHGQTPVTHQRPLKTQNQPELLSSTQQMVQLPCNGNKSFLPQLTDSSEIVVAVSPPSSNQPKTSLDAMGNNNNLGTGTGSYLYSVAQVIGSAGGIGLAHGDQNFPRTPALLPVMQFAGQHLGGLGVSAVGMAVPGYVAQQQLGFGNSEMTWLPVLAGTTGSLGASYCSPYITLDGGYYAHPSGQSSQLASSREINTTKVTSSSNFLQRPEVINDELGQRQNKHRRYSEMNFGQ